MYERTPTVTIARTESSIMDSSLMPPEWEMSYPDDAAVTLPAVLRGIHAALYLIVQGHREVKWANH